MIILSYPILTVQCICVRVLFQSFQSAFSLSPFSLQSSFHPLSHVLSQPLFLTILSLSTISQMYSLSPLSHCTLSHPLSLFPLPPSLTVHSVSGFDMCVGKVLTATQVNQTKPFLIDQGESLLQLRDIFKAEHLKCSPYNKQQGCYSRIVTGIISTIIQF